jgi:hypothetical protein
MMAYKKYIVKQGDCISSIAFKYGFFPDTIWNDSKNSKLKQDRKDPNVLKPGDELYIRDKEEKEESCASEERHSFKKKGVPEIFNIQFKINDEPRANEAYVLDIDGELSEGQTDENGIAEIWIPPNAKKGKISFRDREDEYELDLGDLDPITEISGVQQRLQNMGFYKGDIDGKMSDELEQAIRIIQERHDLEPTGKLNEATRDMIQEEHGG